MNDCIKTSLKNKRIEFLLGTTEYKQTLAEVTKTISSRVLSATNEATVVSIFEIELYSLIKDIFELKFFPEKELSVGTNFHVAKGRIDSKIGALVIEFKSISNLASKVQQQKATKQLIEYLNGLNETGDQDFYGLITNGVICKKILLLNGKIVEGAFAPLSADILDELVRTIILLDKVALTPTNLVKDFAIGDNSLSKRLTKTLFITLETSPTGRSKMLFNEWKELFRLAHDDNSKQKAIEERRAALESAVGESFPKNNVEVEYKALYAIQTTYAIIVKIIAFKVISKLHFNKSLIDFSQLAEGDYSAILQQMQSLENGAIFKDCGVGNLLEGDFFSWYCTTEQWSTPIAEHIKEVFHILSPYEDKGVFDSFERIQDLFKDLFMNIMPDKVRHSLGEYYTPAWLADNLISESIRINGEGKSWKALDPCSGSGTFITILIKKVLSENGTLDNRAKLESVLSRVFAIDLNPLAVLTTRINYFVNIAHLISPDDSFEIPVFLGDSSYVPESITIGSIPCLKYSIHTAKGPINITMPKCVCEDTIAFSQMMSSTEQDILNNDSSSIVSKILNLVPESQRIDTIISNIRSLADTFVFLEKNNWNGIWARIVTNFMTTASLGKFDIIVGNPPWIDWKNLPTGYRERVKQLCIDRNLFSGDSITGGINLNICALITHVAASNWLKEDGVLAFLMPDTILFQQTYEGFRLLKLSESKSLYFQKIYDWSSSGNPFYPVTQNFFSYFVSSQTQDYQKCIPFIRYIKDKKHKKTLINYTHIDSFPFIEDIFIKQHLFAGQAHEHSTKFTICKIASDIITFRKVVGKMSYTAREGIEFYPQELFILSYDPEIRTKTGNVAVRNFQNKKSKYKIPCQTFILETKFLQPLVKGVNIQRFHLTSSEYVVPFPYYEGERSPISIIELEKVSPCLARFFNKHRDVICSQTNYNAKIIGSKYNTEFYALARVGKYSFAPHYVAYRDNTKWGACVISALPTPWGDIKRPQFQNHAVSISETLDGRYITYEEAHFICAILNAPIITDYIVNSSDARTFKINPDINIPLFDIQNPIHHKLSKLSIKAHKNYDNIEIMMDIDNELNKLVMSL